MGHLQQRTLRLRAAVERGGDVDLRFVLDQLRKVVVGKASIRAQANPPTSREGVGAQMLDDLDRRRIITKAAGDLFRNRIGHGPCEMASGRGRTQVAPRKSTNVRFKVFSNGERSRVFKRALHRWCSIKGRRVF